MNGRHRLARAALACLTLSLVGCGNDLSGPSSPSSPSSSTRRTVRFELTGTFSGQLEATFVAASGGGTVESIAGLPWTKDITYVASVPSTALTVGGSGGVPGQTLVVRVLAGGAQVSSTTGTTTSSGIVVVAAPPLVF